MKYLAHISYDGSHFEGFQRLNNGRGVQNELERVLSIIAKKRVVVKGAGRTDALVHAFDQCISFDLDLNIEVNRLKYILNRNLSKYISVLLVEKVNPDFHARFDAKGKVYLYKIYLGEKNPFLQDYTYQLSRRVDVAKMEEAAKVFVGTHNFANFVSGYKKSYESTIFSISLTLEGDIVSIKFWGVGFFRYMVRSIVGALIEVGLGKVSIENLKMAINCPDQQIRFLVAPACGLYLLKVLY